MTAITVEKISLPIDGDQVILLEETLVDPRRGHPYLIRSHADGEVPGQTGNKAGPIGPPAELYQITPSPGPQTIALRVGNKAVGGGGYGYSGQENHFLQL